MMSSLLLKRKIEESELYEINGPHLPFSRSLLNNQFFKNNCRIQALNSPDCQPGCDSINIIDCINAIHCKVSVQFLMVQNIEIILQSQYNFLNSSHILVLINSLELIVDFFNQKLSIASLVNIMSVIDGSVVLQELGVEALFILLHILQRLCLEVEVDSINRRTIAESKFLKHSLALFIENVNVNVNSDKIPIILLALQTILKFDTLQFARYLSVYFPLFSRLILQECKEIRFVLYELILRAASELEVYVVTKPFWE